MIGSLRSRCLSSLGQVLILAAGFGLWTIPAAGQSVFEDTSLALVPEDAGFYCALWRNREQWEALAASKAYQALRNSPFVQLGLTAWENADDETVRSIKEALAVPENQQLVKLLLEAFGDEIFVFGDTGVADQLALFNHINNRMQLAQFEALAEGEDPEDLAPDLIVEAILERVEEMRAPQVVFAGRIQDLAAAQAQLTRLEKLLQQLAESQPLLEGKIVRHTVGAADLLTLTLDGSMIPWDELREDFEGDSDQLEELITRLTSKTISISLGLRGNLLLVSMGPNDEHVGRLGEGRKLGERKELAVVKPFADRKLTSVAYASQAFLERLANVESQLNDVQALLAALLPLAELDEELEEKIADALAETFEDVAESTPQPGAAVAFSFLAPKGYEEYTYGWTEHPELDGSKPLTILEHVGGQPLLVAAGRARALPETREVLTAFCKRLYELGNEIALAKLEGEERATYERLRDAILPLIERFDRADRELLQPAFADGQTAFVLDAQLKSAQLQLFMPPANPALPIPELAIVCGVSDRELVKKGVAECFAVLQELVNVIRTVAPEGVPEIQLPAPQRREVTEGELFVYGLPGLLGVDSQLAPTAGQSAEALVLTLAPSTAERLLKRATWQTQGLLAERERPLAGAAACDFAGLVDMATPWIRYAYALSQSDEPPATVDLASVALPFDDLLQVLKCFRAYESITYQEGEAWITHGAYIFEDLP